MDYRVAQSALSRLAAHVRALYVVILGLLLLNGMLGLLLWHTSNRQALVLVPPGITGATRISTFDASPRYLEALAAFALSTRLNVTPETVDGSNATLLTLVAPGAYTAFKAQLALDAKHIKAQHISSTFYLDALKVRGDSVTATGRLTRWVAERRLGSERKTYRLTFSSNGFMRRLTRFKELSNETA